MRADFKLGADGEAIHDDGRDWPIFRHVARRLIFTPLENAILSPLPFTSAGLAECRLAHFQAHD